MSPPPGREPEPEGEPYFPNPNNYLDSNAGHNAVHSHGRSNSHANSENSNSNTSAASAAATSASASAQVALLATVQTLQSQITQSNSQIQKLESETAKLARKTRYLESETSYVQMTNRKLSQELLDLKMSPPEIVSLADAERCRARLENATNEAVWAFSYNRFRGGYGRAGLVEGRFDGGGNRGELQLTTSGANGNQSGGPGSSNSQVVVSGGNGINNSSESGAAANGNTGSFRYSDEPILYSKTLLQPGESQTIHAIDGVTKDCLSFQLRVMRESKWWWPLNKVWPGPSMWDYNVSDGSKIVIEDGWEKGAKEGMAKM
jgi:hypothetical protein